MNRHLDDNVLYNSPIGRQITELRKSGDRLVLYTENNELYKRFKDWKQIIQVVPYLRGRSLIGVDLYFPKSEAKALLRALRAWTLKERVSAR